MTDQPRTRPDGTGDALAARHQDMSAGGNTLLTAEAVIQTECPERYLARLGTHAAKMRQHLGSRLRAHGSGQTPPEMQHAEWSATRGTVRLNWGGWTMQATPGTLTLRAEAPDQTSLQRIQDMLTTRLEKFGRREHLTVTWQQAAIPAGEPDPAG